MVRALYPNTQNKMPIVTIGPIRGSNVFYCAVSVQNRVTRIRAINGDSLDQATDVELDAMIALAMPSLEEIEAMATDDGKEWRDDTSWIDDVD
jgi:hypothetical protein